ncbi:MAG TPA: AAA family ATPase [Candidatus Saccharimonadia bacterium]|nr:AAA family ATPase [Candidatus Saccharimonadia bacterium]
MAENAYRNVTISGLPGNGSTTLLKLLKEKLSSENWKGFSGGEFMRDYATKKGLFDPKTNKFHHDATVYGEDFDREVDFGMREKLEKENHWILESWLSGFFAQQVPGVLKVLLICSEDAVRIDRIVNRDKVSIAEAKSHIMERTDKNLGKWSRMYAKQWQDWVVKPGTVSASSPIDFWLPDLYDVVIDTYSSSREETLEKVVQALRKS